MTKIRKRKFNYFIFNTNNFGEIKFAVFMKRVILAAFNFRFIYKNKQPMWISSSVRDDPEIWGIDFGACA